VDYRDWWLADNSQKANALAKDISMLAERARGAGFEVVAHILGLAAQEAVKEGEQTNPGLS
jgi:hypothetical protein